MTSPARADHSQWAPEPRATARAARGGASFGGDDFDAALAGRCDRLITADGRTLPLATRRWDDDANDDDRWILDRCTGPTLDFGCGPGRLVVALAARGVPALGIDVSAWAIARCRVRGATALRRDALGPLPGEGSWSKVVLADGNIGIGGDPVRLLRRCRVLLAARGSVIVELDPETDSWQGLAHLGGSRAPIGVDDSCDGAGPVPRRWFPWAVVGADAIDDVASRAGLLVVDRGTAPDRARCFVELTPRPTPNSPIAADDRFAASPSG